MGLSLLCYPGAVYEQAFYSSGIGGLFTTVIFLPVVASVYLTVFFIVLCFIAWVLRDLSLEISALLPCGTHLRSIGVTPRLRNIGSFYWLVCCGHSLLGLVCACGAFFRGGLVSIVWNVGAQPHIPACVQANAYRSTYSDSGAWDTALLLTFDVLFRAVFVLSIVPLSEHSVVEKMSVKVNSELVSLGFTSRCRKNLTLRSVLLNLAGCLLLLIIFFLYTALLVL